MKITENDLRILIREVLNEVGSDSIHVYNKTSKTIKTGDIFEGDPIKIGGQDIQDNQYYKVIGEDVHEEIKGSRSTTFNVILGVIDDENNMSGEVYYFKPESISKIED